MQECPDLFEVVDELHDGCNYFEINFLRSIFHILLL